MNKFRFWSLIWGLGLVGQLCWNLVNQWFNTFVYAKIARDSNIVTAIVMSTAIVSALTTFVFGTLSDRIGSRRKFVSLGYIAWGVFTIVFGFTEFIADGTVGGISDRIFIIAVIVVFAACVMSFFGSLGNDSGFNAWINDRINDKNRGQLGAALAVQPIVGAIVGTFGGGMLIGRYDNYQRLFWVMGLLVIVMGIVSLVFLRDAEHLKPHRVGRFREQFLSVFNLNVFRKHRELFWACMTAIAFFIPFNVYFVHMGNWLLFRMGYTPDLMGLIQGTGLIAAMGLAIPGTLLINRHKTPVVALTGVVFNATGLLMLNLFIRPGVGDTTAVFVPANIPLLACVFLVGAGLILITQSMIMWIKQLYPEESRGQFEGMRILAFVLIPMLVGTFIGNIVVRRGAGTVINEFGMVENIPTESIFQWALILLIPIFVPLFFASRHYYRRLREEKYE